jgi:hypothetical protein
LIATGTRSSLLGSSTTSPVRGFTFSGQGVGDGVSVGVGVQVWVGDGVGLGSGVEVGATDGGGVRVGVAVAGGVLSLQPAERADTSPMRTVPTRMIARDLRRRVSSGWVILVILRGNRQRGSQRGPHYSIEA